MNYFVYIPVFLILFLAADTGADTFSISYENGKVVKRYPEGSRPVIGLALSGGGSRGIAHIGVVEALERAGIRVERIAGTSMGSVVGGLYAAGYTPGVISSFLTDNDLSQILSSDPKRRNVYIGQKDINQWPIFDVRFNGFKAQLLPASFSTGQKLVSLLSWLTLGPTYECGNDFDRLPIPFRAVATNCITGNAKVLGNGNLARAIQASSTIPGLFAPVEWGDSLLVDGGLTNNLPVNTVRDMGSDFIIAVAIEESMHSREELDNPLNLADQVTSIPMRNVTALSRRMADFVISPDMSGFSSKDFSPILDLIARGREAAIDSLPALMKSISLASASYRKTAIRTITVSPTTDSLIVSAVFSRRTPADKVISYAHIAGCIEELWDTGRYFSVEAELNEQT
ncbi:MAG: patatin-like phospholipase family protein, partial [Candidatus Latescibacterota bacterium]